MFSTEKGVIMSLKVALEHYVESLRAKQAHNIWQGTSLRSFVGKSWDHGFMDLWDHGLLQTQLSHESKCIGISY
jgi:hypothetical protein